MKKAFLILGAMRSGTSATSHIISEFGVNFGNPKNFFQGPANPIFFELNWVIEYNDKLINTLGYKLPDLFLPLTEDFNKIDTLKIEEELQYLIDKEWPYQETIGIKDPRFSWTIPFWHQFLSKNNYEVNIIFVFRHPSGFLNSSKRLFHDSGWSETRHLNFWLQFNLAASHFTRNFPIYYLNYDFLMSKPLEEIKQIANFFNLDIKLATNASLVINNSYYHHKELTETFDPLVDSCYRLLCSQQSLSEEDYQHYREKLFLRKLEN